MKARSFALVGAIAISACSGQAADTLPPLPTIENATLAYANCVYAAARKLAARSGGANLLAEQAVASCRELRAKALALKGVPVMFPSVAEYDSTHLGLARQTIENSRANSRRRTSSFDGECLRAERQGVGRFQPLRWQVPSA